VFKEKSNEMVCVLLFYFFVLGHFLMFESFWSFFSFGHIGFFLLVYFVNLII